METKTPWAAEGLTLSSREEKLAHFLLSRGKRTQLERLLAKARAGVSTGLTSPAAGGHAHVATASRARPLAPHDRPPPRPGKVREWRRHRRPRRLRGATRPRASAGESAGDRDRASARSAGSTAAAAAQGNAVAARRGVAGRDAIARERDAPSARTHWTRAADASRGYAAASATDARARGDASTGFPGRGDGDANTPSRCYSASSLAVGPDACAERNAASGAGDGLAHLSGHGPHRSRR